MLQFSESTEIMKSKIKATKEIVKYKLKHPVKLKLK